MLKTQTINVSTERNVDLLSALRSQSIHYFTLHLFISKKRPPYYRTFRITYTWQSRVVQWPETVVLRTYHLAPSLPLLPPYKRKRLKEEIQDKTTMLTLTNSALAIPSPTWLQKFPYMLHIFIHWRSGCPNFAKDADCAAAATADKVRYAIICTNK